MCGIAGIVHLKQQPIPQLSRQLEVMNQLIAHRGPDGCGSWVSDNRAVGLTHRRLAIIDLSNHGAQPMAGANNQLQLTFNGEIYNYRELKTALPQWPFQSNTDTETILASYHKYGHNCLKHLHGMFAFALWDNIRGELFCARDHFGIKPFYYLIQDQVFYFASEAKALLPFIDNITTDEQALAEYVVFQHPIGEQTLFRGIKQLLPGHQLTIRNGQVTITKYWDVTYNIDQDHTEKYFYDRLGQLMNESMQLHLRSDVEIGSYLSGGIDSSLIAIMANSDNPANNKAFHGKFTDHPGYDESEYAKAVAQQHQLDLYERSITHQDFIDNIHRISYILDYPIAGPGSFPQYMVSELASQQVKVVLGGQGGDEIFGGYARYIIGYLEQCLKGAIDGTYQDGHFLVTLESIIPNLGLLQEYKPLLKKFWQEGLFEAMDQRYFRLINRATDIIDEIDVASLNLNGVKTRYSAIFNDPTRIHPQAYFNLMTRFDFKCLLPALLHIEDRMSMAHGLESRVPFLYAPLIEFIATIPASYKFPGGNMKHLLKTAFAPLLPPKLINRRDKMGFPVPLQEWFAGPLATFVQDTFNSDNAKQRPFINTQNVLKHYNSAGRFSRKMWGLLNLELWQQNFHDQHYQYRQLLRSNLTEMV